MTCKSESSSSIVAPWLDEFDQDDVPKVPVLAQNPPGLSLSTPLDQQTNAAGNDLTTGVVCRYPLPTGEYPICKPNPWPLKQPFRITILYALIGYAVGPVFNPSPAVTSGRYMIASRARNLYDTTS